VPLQAGEQLGVDGAVVEGEALGVLDGDALGVAE